MGGCLGTSEYKLLPALQVSNVEECNQCIGEHVQILGRVGHAGKVFESPFTEKQGVAMKIEAIIPSHTGGAQKTSFTARSCTSFDLVDGPQSVRILVSAQSQWRLDLNKTGDIFNIYSDSQTSPTILYSGGAKIGLKSEAKPRPNALKFWRDFNGGKDPPERMTPFEGKGMVGFGNRPRMAREYVLSVGDFVSVVGTLNKTADGDLVLEAAGRGYITNSTASCIALKTCNATERCDTQVPEVAQMSR